MNNFLKVGKVPHAIIVQMTCLSNFDEFLKYFLKFVICKKHGCNICSWCKKINENAYYDLAMYDAKINIKKDDISYILNEFSKNYLESINKKFYVIKNIEFASKKVFNMLLKFIEENNDNVYGIFTTNNIHLVAPTIRSRCFVHFLESDSDDKISSILQNRKLSNIQIEIIKKCFNDFNDMTNRLDTFIGLYDDVIKLKSMNLQFANQCLNNFKKMTYNDIYLFIEISKNLFKSISLKLLDIQNKLYLNPNKALVFTQIFNLFKSIKY